MVRKSDVSAKRVERKDEGMIKFVVVCDKYKVPSDFLQDIQKQYDEIRPLLMKDTGYMAADLCGCEMWGVLGSPMRRLVCICLQHIALAPTGGMKLVSGVFRLI